MSLLSGVRVQKQAQREAEMTKALIHHEAKVGGQLFGHVPKGTRREFFCLDRHTWIWHEEWTDEAGKRRIMTTRYDVRLDGVLKSQGHNTYQRLSGVEAGNFYKAVELYGRQVTAEYDRLLQLA